MTQIQKVTNETVERLTSESSPYFKPFKFAGGIMLIGSAVIGIGLCFFPATMPVGAAVLAGNLLKIGTPLWAVSVLTQDKEKQQKTGNISVTKGLSGAKKVFAILKNLL
jgi:hypothetical protein